jgi:hypothetical protein
MFHTLIERHMKMLMSVIRKQHMEKLINITKYIFKVLRNRCKQYTTQHIFSVISCYALLWFYLPRKGSTLWCGGAVFLCLTPSLVPNTCFLHFSRGKNLANTWASLTQEQNLDLWQILPHHPSNKINHCMQLR